MTEQPSLVRGLGPAAATSVVVGTVIGTGIFLKTRVMMCNVDTPWLVIAAWVLAGGLSLAGALTYAELAAMMPRAGGEYVFIREGYGRRLAFLYGWTQFAVAYSGSQAAKGVGFAIFLNSLVGGGSIGHSSRSTSSARRFPSDWSRPSPWRSSSPRRWSIAWPCRPAGRSPCS